MVWGLMMVLFAHDGTEWHRICADLRFLGIVVSIVGFLLESLERFRCHIKKANVEVK